MVTLNANMLSTRNAMMLILKAIVTDHVKGSHQVPILPNIRIGGHHSNLYLERYLFCCIEVSFIILNDFVK